MDTEDGPYFIKHLAAFIRTHEKALANALQLQTVRKPPAKSGVPTSPTSTHTPRPPVSSSSATSNFASAFSLPSLSFTSQSTKPAKLSLTPHHLFYLLTRFEELGIPVGPMNVRLENIHSDTSPANYVSFLDSSHRARRSRSSDALSIHSVSSVKSVMSGMSSLWNSFGLGSSSGSASKSEKAKAALNADLKYTYSAFTKIPCLRLCPDPKARLISGYEEFPFDTAVPLLAFKNVTALEINDIDIRQFYGWDQLAERLRSLVIRRGGIEDPAELIIAIVLDDMDRRRRRSSKNQASPMHWSIPSPSLPSERGSSSAPNSPKQPAANEQVVGSAKSGHSIPRPVSTSPRSHSRTRERDSSRSPVRPASERKNSSGSHPHKSHRMRRSDSASSRGSSNSTMLAQSASLQGYNLMGNLPSNKWRWLRYLSLADNSMTSISFASLAPLAGSLTSLDLSSNLFVSVPDALSTLTNLRALNLSNNMIDSLHSLTRHAVPPITALNLRGNRLASLAGIERLTVLSRLDIRENKLTDPTELARLTGTPNLTEVWVYANPFVKTHSSTYRITIFNLFRNTPGYKEDIQIDATGPGLVERRSLVDRVPEPPAVLAPKPTVATAPPREIHKRDVEIHRAPENPAVRQQPDEKGISIYNGDVARPKKKTAKRRVVELSRGDGSNEMFTAPEIAPRVSPAHFEHHNTPPKPGSSFNERPRLPVSPPSSVKQKPLTVGEAPPTPPGHHQQHVHQHQNYPRHHHHSQHHNNQHHHQNHSPALSPGEDWSQGGDEYKKRIEALKNEVGSGWLTVLSGDDSWDGVRRASPSPSAVQSKVTAS